MDQDVASTGKVPDAGAGLPPPEPAAPKAVAPPEPDDSALLALRTRSDFRFKVQTVKWFGLLCALVIVAMIGLGFLYLGSIIKASEVYHPRMDFSGVLATEAASPNTVLLGLEHDALGMRDKRGTSALYMRVYTQFLAIIAGTILSLLGAVFVLARVDSVATASDVSAGNVKWALSSSSPGVIVAIVGACLIGGVVFLSSDHIQVLDGPVYLGRTAADATVAANTILKQADYAQKKAENMANSGKGGVQ